jgi:hypothetical protein
MEDTLTLLEDDPEFTDKLIQKLLLISDAFMPEGNKLYPYQVEFITRIYESLINDDGATITALVSRQAGKSETLAIATCVIIVFFPILAKIYPEHLYKYRNGCLVGAFAPVDEQADNLFGRIQDRMKSESAMRILEDPDIDEKATARSRTIMLRNGSLVRKTTCHPKATIEGRTYHLILVDECFPAGTPILTTEGWIPIEKIVNGERKDWIVATQGSDGVEWSRLKATYKTRRNNELIRVDHQYGTFYATANHPIVVGREKIPAIRLRPGQDLSLVQRVTESTDTRIREMQKINCGSLFQFSQSISEERDGTAASQKEDVRYLEENWSSAYDPWRERKGSYRATRTSAEELGGELVPRVCSANWREEEGRPTVSLQNRHSQFSANDSSGDRRRISHDPGAKEIGSEEDYVVVKSRVVSVSVLKSGSDEFGQFSDGADYVYTLEVEHPSHTYVAAGIFVGNCQGAEKVVIDKKISPMGTATNATMIFTGTPDYTKNVFYNTIQINKRNYVSGEKKNHFEYDWKTVSKYNEQYKKRIEKEVDRIGIDSNEFKLSYRLIWVLEKGMFTTAERLDELGDNSMQSFVYAFHRTPIVAGIDVGRKRDRTIVTAVYVDWNNPDPYGLYYHQVLNWLDLEGMDWEQQYFRIDEFLSNYNLWKVGIDTGGLGDVVAQRLKILMPHVDVVELGSSSTDQSERWKYLMQLIEHNQISWPAGAKIRKRKVYTRFRQEMEDLEIKFKGPYVLAEAPNVTNAHDDYPDSLAMACILSKLSDTDGSANIEVSSNVLYSRHLNQPGAYTRSLR